MVGTRTSVVLAALVLGAGLAAASQVGYRPVSLQELVGSSTAIVRVVVKDPAHAMVDVPIRAGDTDCGVYAMVRYSLAVTEVVHAKPGAPKLGSEVEAWWANGRSLQQISERACADGTRKSPIYSLYAEGEGDLTAGRDVLLFLDHVDGWGWEVAAVKAWESPSAEARVRAALK